MARARTAFMTLFPPRRRLQRLSATPAILRKEAERRAKCGVQACLSFNWPFVQAG
jgi:hypothetical protein